jgi:hydrogenase maturation factor HypF (carbamoyltransferase family)
MSPRYFKPETRIETLCEHCGNQYKETLGRLYSDIRLICPTCGHEHTTERENFRQTVDETEALIDGMSAWTYRVSNRVRNWWKNI